MKYRSMFILIAAAAQLIVTACSSSTVQSTEPSESIITETSKPPTQVPEPTIASFEREFVTTSGDDDMLVGAYFYPWWGPGREHWDGGYLGTPTLGEYTSSDPEVINRQIDWAAGHGIDFFVASWWGRNDFTDNAIKAFTEAELADEIKFSIIYESTGRLGMNENGEIDLDDPTAKQNLVSDFTYLAKTFFENPNYLKIDERPVIILYLTRIFVGDVAKTLSQARAAVMEATGQDVFIIGEEVWWQEPDVPRLGNYDGITGYIMHSWEPEILANFNEEVAAHFQTWASAAENAGIYFIPDVIPGFDDKGYDPSANTPPIPRSLELFEGQLVSALNLTVGSSRMILITSWNEWHEYTSIEPADEYGFNYLDLLQTILDTE